MVTCAGALMSFNSGIQINEATEMHLLPEIEGGQLQLRTNELINQN